MVDAGNHRGNHNGSRKLKLVTLEGKTCYRLNEREKSRKLIKIGLGFLRDWLKGQHRRSDSLDRVCLLLDSR